MIKMTENKLEKIVESKMPIKNIGKERSDVIEFPIRKRAPEEKYTIDTIAKKVDNIIPGAGTGVYIGNCAILVGAMFTSTFGAIGLGFYEGLTGEKIFGHEGLSALVVGMAGYVPQIIANWDEKMNKRKMFDPKVPIMCTLMYGISYGCGHMLKLHP